LALKSEALPRPAQSTESHEPQITHTHIERERQRLGIIWERSYPD